MSDWQELGRRAVACKGWRWMPGMLTTHGQRMITGAEEDRPCHPWPAGYLWVPDFSDPAAVGCLLALVRSAWGDPLMYVAPGPGWYVGRGRVDVGIAAEGATEAEALVAALEAAP